MRSYERSRAGVGGTHAHGAGGSNALAGGALVPGKQTLVEQTFRGGGPIQRKVSVGGEAAGGGEAAAAAAATSVAGSGSPLPEALRTRMEGAFGTHFGDVRVFLGSQAEALGARAFTRGSELHFGPGEYDPDSSSGQELIGHELAHVVQQRAGRVAGEQAYGGLINADAGLEREADEAGARAARGEPAGLAAGGSSAATGPIQRAIRIGNNKSAKPMTTWKEFTQKLPPKFNALLEYQEEITTLLEDKDPQPHEFASYQHLLERFEAPPNQNQDVNDPSSKCREMDVGAAAVLLAQTEARDLLLFDREESPEVVGQALARGKILVVCKNHSVKKPQLGKLFGPLCSQIIICSDDSMTFVALWLSVRHQMNVCGNAMAVGSWLVDGEYVIAQTPQMRGDMHDVLPALALDPKLKVALCVTTPTGYADADIILNYYSSYRGRVVVCPFTGSELGTLGGKCKKIGEATEVLVQAVQKDPVNARKTITGETTGYPTEEDNEGYARVCAQLGFQRGIPYLIINYRDSGHKPGKHRDKSHPELDTGTDGFQQMMQCADELGFVPVPMGLPPGMTRSTWKGPHLIEYWSFDCCKETRTRNKRQTEYGLLRYLAEHFSIRALAMRSGGTDAMVYAGIETISLDLASSGKSDKELETAKIGSRYHEGGNRSWMRAAVRDLIMPGKFHQGFFEEPRPDEGKNGDWGGAFSERDVHHIAQTIHFFFGTGQNPMSGLLELAPNNPLANPQAFAEQLARHRSRDDARRFLTYIDEMNDARHKLYESMSRDLPVELLRLEVELVKLELERLRLQVKLMQLQLQLQELQILQMLRGQSLEDSLGSTTPPRGTGPSQDQSLL